VGIVHARCKCCALCEGQIERSNVMISAHCIDDDIFDFEFFIIITTVIIILL
jgi:hypothetical protein